MANKEGLADLKRKQKLPLENKIKLTKIKTSHFYNAFKGQVYLSWSGGKDSTTLKHIMKTMGLDIPFVFCNTGLEYPEIVEFVKRDIKDLSEYKEIESYGYTIRTYETVNQNNIVILKPKMTYKEVLEEYGYPVVSKEQSQYLYDYMTSDSEKLRELRLNGNKDGNFKISDKWKYLKDAPFPVSNKCCDIMKKRPFARYESETGRHPMLATMAYESDLRKQRYIYNGGCNVYDNKRPLSAPMSFWTKQDVLKYIKRFNLDIPEVYGEVVESNLKLETTKLDRTGCIFCMYGVHLESQPNRFQKLKKTHPKLYKYAMNNLGLKEVLDYINVPYGDFKEQKQCSLLDNEMEDK